MNKFPGLAASPVAGEVLQSAPSRAAVVDSFRRPDPRSGACRPAGPGRHRPGQPQV